uniref:Reverse transcriptase domain-containing protein n=1 Tax=Fagus sylvatica TaxID=28930 RepID=A0A2N9GCU1_FAGSY
MAPRTEATWSVFGPLEDFFPIGIPARPGKFLAIREFHVVHGCVFFPTCPELADQLVASQEDSARKHGNVDGKILEFSARPYFVGLFSRAWPCTEASLGSQDMILRTEAVGMFLMPRVLTITPSFLVRFWPVKCRIEALIMFFRMVKEQSVRFSFRSGPRSGQTLVKLGQPWSNLVEFGQSSPKSGKCIPDHVLRISRYIGLKSASGAIRELQYPVWLSNTVVVKKKNGKWRVCIDFTDLNKACPKDPFPLPRIDQLVDSATGDAQLNFLDAFQGYHQILMSVADQEKTSFITPKGAYCYNVMTFGLKNARATYQRMVTKMFRHLIGKTVEVYIDDMLIKSLREEDHITDLRQVFDVLRENRLCLNASKCTFGVSTGKFLSHVVSRRGIEANPNQIAALVNLAEPRNIKQVQHLTEMIVALGRFISRSADKCKPFFRLLGKRSKFVRNEECSAAFQGIKAYLSTPLCLSIPNLEEPLFLRAMDEIELRYLPFEKAALALLQAAKKLSHYFQSSKVTVLSDLPLKMLLQRASNSKGSGAGVVLVSPEGLVLEQAVRLKFLVSNNKAEYEALLIGLKTARKLGACHLQSNGQAEVSNKITLSEIKKKLEEAKGKWVEELLSVLWTHRTTVRKSTGETPFALTYDVEAVIPLEVNIPTTQTTDFNVETNEDNLRKDLDPLEERRDLATVWLASYQQRIRRKHDKNVRPRIFRVGELVLRKVMDNTKKPNEGRLGPNQEGP